MPDSRTRVTSMIAVSPIVTDLARSSTLYGETLGLDFYQLENGYRGTEKLGGIGHFGLWPLGEAARTCFGDTTWPSTTIPQAAIEFGVEDLDAIAAAMGIAGHQRLADTASDEVQARFLSPDGLVIVLTQTETT